jgi:hypothetical protein
VRRALRYYCQDCGKEVPFDCLVHACLCTEHPATPQKPEPF